MNYICCSCFRIKQTKIIIQNCLVKYKKIRDIIFMLLKFQYTANQFRGNRMLEVVLPSPHHQLGVEDGLARLDQDTATLTGVQIGHGQV